jgi:hypothetical protein
MASHTQVAPWRRVKWTRAGQLAGLADIGDALAGLHDAPPAVAFAALRAQQPQACVRFMAQCLPRFEAVQWVGRALSRIPAATPAAAEVRRGIGDWIADPSDKRRRLVFDLAQALGFGHPEGAAGLAVFLSGGSMSPPEVEQGVAPPPGTFGQAVAAAILLAGMTKGPQNFDAELEVLLGLALDIAEAE